MTSDCGVSRALCQMFSMKVTTVCTSGTGYSRGTTGGGGSLRSVKNVKPARIETCSSGRETAYSSSTTGSVCVSSQKSGSESFASAVSLSRIRRCSTVLTLWMSSR